MGKKASSSGADKNQHQRHQDEEDPDDEPKEKSVQYMRHTQTLIPVGLDSIARGYDVGRNDEEIGQVDVKFPLEWTDVHGAGMEPAMTYKVMSWDWCVLLTEQCNLSFSFLCSSFYTECIPVATLR